MSLHVLEGPLEQGTDIKEVNPHTNDKWAQRTAQYNKGKVGWHHKGVGRPPWLAEGPVGPTTFRFHVASPGWLLMSVWGGMLQLTPVAPPVYMRGGGANGQHPTLHLNS